MPKSTTKLLETYFKVPNPGLRAYLAHVKDGQPDEYRTPFYKGKSLDEVLGNWDKSLVAIRDQWPSLYGFESDLGKKVGPMSVMKPLKDRLDDIESYYSSITPTAKELSADAIRSTCKEFACINGVRLRSGEKTWLMMRKNTNSGNPYFTKRANVITDTIPGSVWMLEDGSVKQELSTGRSWPACAVLGWRGQEGGRSSKDVKQRVVWMMPLAVNIAELRFYQPLIQACQEWGLVPAWEGTDAVDKRITGLFDTKGKDDLVICTDFSKFDQHFNKCMQRAARNVIASLMTNSLDSYNWLNYVFPIKYMIPLMCSENMLRTGDHGMASGSGGTNADETLAHRCLQYEAALSHGKMLNPNSQCLGDDGVLSYPGCSVKDVVQAYTSHGLEMNPEKQYASKQDCVYLRRWHHEQYRVDGVCVGVYSTNRALGRLMEQERFYDPDEWGAKMVALRQLSIIENCKYHPLREQFAEYCMKGDKYRLGLDIPGFLDDLEGLAEKSIDYMPDFLGYTKSLKFENANNKKYVGINDWWIVNYLKSKR